VSPIENSCSPSPFGQNRPRIGARRAVHVAGLTLATMLAEIATGLAF
jgi:hypothetical protein